VLVGELQRQRTWKNRLYIECGVEGRRWDHVKILAPGQPARDFNLKQY